MRRALALAADDATRAARRRSRRSRWSAGRASTCGARPDRQPVRRLLSVRVRRLDQEPPRARRPAVLRPLPRAAGSQQRDPQGDPRERREAAASRRSMRKIGDYYAQLHGGTGDRAQGHGAARAGSRAHRRDQGRRPASRPSSATTTCRHVGVLRLRRRARLQGRDAVHADLRAGRPRLPDRDYYLKDDANAQKLRADYEQHVVEDAAARRRHAGEGRGRREGGACRSRRRWRRTRSTASRSATRRNIYHKMSRDEVKKLMPNFNMSQFLERAEAPPGDSANVTEPEFLKAVDQVIASTALPDLKTYMRWHIVHSNAHMLPKTFVDENFAFYGKTLTGAQGAAAALEALRRRGGQPISAKRSARLRRAHVRRRGQGPHAGDGRTRSRPRSPPTSRRSPGCRTRPRRRPRPSCAPSPTRSAIPIAGATTRRCASSAATPTGTRSARTRSATAGRWPRSASPSTRRSG